MPMCKKNLMHCRLNLDRTLDWTLFLSLLVSPAVAHNVEISKDVAGTWHVEPNHTPKAGETARAWVALTRKGGQILPLEQASCQMAAYSQPRKKGDVPVLQPAVKAISIEKYRGIPGADIVFPQTGLYQLELSCTPKTQGDFQPFQMKYDVTVATGAAAPTPKTESSAQKTPVSTTEQERKNQSNRKAQEWSILAIAVPVVIGLAILTILVRSIMKQRQ